MFGKRPIGESVFKGACLAAVLIPLAVLGYLLFDVITDAVTRLDWSFIESYPSRKAEQAGILPALVGSFYLIIITTAIAVPLGIAAAIYLEEYGGQSWWARIVEVNIANLAGVPSIIYGLLGLGVFVRLFGMDRSLLAGACTLGVLILPIVIMASREALRNVPNNVREASYGLGATKLQTIRGVIMPLALPGMLTGSILAVSRAIGETAPLVVVGAATYISFLPEDPMDDFSALPIQIFDWVSRPQEAFLMNAAAGIVVLLSVLLVINGFALWLRARLQNRYR
jgi:phosphate transport system permease protein